MMQRSLSRCSARNQIQIGSILVSLLLTLHADISSAQRVDWQPVEISGVITAMERNQITLRADGKIYAADVSEVRSLPGGGILDIVPPEFKIKGQRSTESLEKGMFVRFEAEIERFKMAKDPISRLTVFSRTPFTEFGFVEPPGPGIDDPDFAEKMEAAQAEKEKNEQRKGPKRFMVAGILEKSSGSKITMLVPHEGDQRKVTALVSPDAIVDFEMNSLNFASIGNRITAKGVSIVPQHFYATEVTVYIDPDKKLVKIRERLRDQAVKEGRDPDEVDRMIAGDPFKEVAEEEAAKLAENMAKEEAEKVKTDKKAADPDKVANDKTLKTPRPAPAIMLDEAESKKIDGRRKRGLTGKIIKIN